jgi:predicted transcriptional regulator
MSAWQHRCPEGHTSLETRANGYRCHSCDLIYEGDPIDASKVDGFPVERDVATREIGDREDILRELIADVDSHDRDYAQIHHLPDSLGSGKQLGAVLQHMRKDGLAATVGYSTGRSHWQPTDKGREAVETGDLWPDDGCDEAAEDNDNLDVRLSTDLQTAVGIDAGASTKLVLLVLREAEEPLTADEMGDIVGVSHKTAQRALDELSNRDMAVHRTRPRDKPGQRPLEWATDERVFPDDGATMTAEHYRRLGREGVADD